jgi:formate dehydrogenase maturation protein FdhE
MSQGNFKRPASVNPKARQDERLLKVMALQLQNQEQLDALLAGADPLMRHAMLERLIPYLSFVPEEATANCPACGMKRGSILPHECLGAN